MRNLIPQPPRPRSTAALANALALATLLALTACGPKADSSPATAQSASPGAVSTGDAGYAAVVSRTDLRGDVVGHNPDMKATVVVVFASWCVHCRSELAMLRQFAKDRPTLQVIGVNAYEEFDNISDEKKLAAFLLAEHPWLTVVRADGSLLAKLGGVRKIPSLFVYDRDGNKVQDFRRSKRKPPTAQELAGLIDPLLG